MSRHSVKFTSLVAAAVLTSLVGCGAPPSDSASTSPTIPADAEQVEQTNAADATDEADAIASADPTNSQKANASDELDAGQYCYEAETDDVSGVVRLTVNPDQTVSGDSQATIHNEEQSYYSSYWQDFAGTLDGDQLDLDVTTWIEYDVQNESATWTVSAQQLDDTRNVYSPVDCDLVQNLFVNADGLEADELTAYATAVHEHRVEFPAGSTSTTVERGLVRAERDVLLLGAQGGQQMTLDISSLEDNAAFDVVSPSGQILVTEGTSEDLLLPETGDYEVIVGSTRGNTTYELYIEIE